jgi:hypothetical protein
MPGTQGKLVTNSTVSGVVSLTGSNTLSGSNDFLGAVSFLDANLTFKDEADPTKQLTFSLSSISSGATRNVSWPDVGGGSVVVSNLTTTNLSNGTGSVTVNAGAGATLSGNTKTVNLGTAGVSGSTTNVNIGSAVSGALGTLTVNSPTATFAGSVSGAGPITAGFAALTAGTTAMAFAAAPNKSVTPNATATFTTTVPPAGTVCTLVINTSGTTSYTITFGSGFKATGTLATGTVTAKTFAMAFISDGTNVIEMSRTVAM